MVTFGKWAFEGVMIAQLGDGLPVFWTRSRSRLDRRRVEASHRSHRSRSRTRENTTRGDARTRFARRARTRAPGCTPRKRARARPSPASPRAPRPKPGRGSTIFPEVYYPQRRLTG